MDTDYPVKLQIILEPVGQPWIEIAVEDQTVIQQLTKTTNFDFEFVAKTQSSICVTHYNKLPTDPTTAVIVKRLSFFGIDDPRFVWAGNYQPDYPEPWSSLQSTKPSQLLKAHPYLGWNGVWRLDFGVPVFTWMHQIQNLGWIYD
jgi:hypothetical protein